MYCVVKVLNINLSNVYDCVGEYKCFARRQICTANPFSPADNIIVLIDLSSDKGSKLRANEVARNST